LSSPQIKAEALDDGDACAELLARFYAAKDVIAQRALWKPDDPTLPLGTCRYCGRSWQKWARSKLDGHAACIVTEDFKHHVGTVLKASPRLTYAMIAKLLGVTSGIVRSWAFSAGIAGPISHTLRRTDGPERFALHPAAGAGRSSSE